MAMTAKLCSCDELGLSSTTASFSLAGLGCILIAGCNFMSMSCLSLHTRHTVKQLQHGVSPTLISTECLKARLALSAACKGTMLLLPACCNVKEEREGEEKKGY